MSARCLIILGMHRSGTSAAAGVMNLLGVDFGRRLMQAKPDNPVGFWEHTVIAEIHEHVLRELRSSWHSILDLPPKWETSPDLPRFEDRLIQVINEDFRRSAFWGVKDPRMCRLLPLWEKLYPRLGFAVQPYYLHMVRDPYEVVSSLCVRNGHWPDKFLALWLTYVLEAERATRGAPRVFLTFDELLRNPNAAVLKIKETLRVEFPNASPDTGERVGSFLRPRLKRQSRSAASSLAATLNTGLAEEVYRACLESHDGIDDRFQSVIHTANAEIEEQKRSFWARSLESEVKSQRAMLADWRYTRTGYLVNLAGSVYAKIRKPK